MPQLIANVADSYAAQRRTLHSPSNMLSALQRNFKEAGSALASQLRIMHCKTF